MAQEDVVEISLLEFAVFQDDRETIERALRAATSLSARDMHLIADWVSGAHKRPRGRPSDAIGDAFIRRQQAPIDQTAVAAFFAERALKGLRDKFGARHKVELPDGRRVSVLNLAAEIGVRRWDEARAGKFSKVSQSRVYELLRRPKSGRKHLLDEYMKFCAK